MHSCRNGARSDDRTPRRQRGRYVRKEWAAKARNHSRVASALPHRAKASATRRNCDVPASGTNDDDLRQHKSDQSEDRRGEGDPPSMAVHDRLLGPHCAGTIETGLSWLMYGEGTSSRIGENPPYGMIGRIEETSASFEARSAPRSYPTSITGNRAFTTRSLRRSAQAANVRSSGRALAPFSY
jgi:hypothetical protein